MNSGVIWVRVSSEEQAGGYSPDAQLRALQAAAKTNEIDILKLFNVAESAKTSDARKKFKEMLAFVEEHQVSYLIAEKTDRLLRNVYDLAKIYRLIEQKDLNVFLVQENRIVNKSSSPAEKAFFEMAAIFATYQGRVIGTEALKGMREKAREGGYPCRAPIGYINAPDPADLSGKRRIIKIDSKRAPLIKKAFELYAEGGFSIATLRDELNRLGLRTKPTSKQPNSEITTHGLAVILNNPFYYGWFEWDKNLWKGSYEPLISRELFDKVHAQLRLNCSYSRPASKKIFAFKPFLRCGYCHCSITAEAQTGKGGHGNYVYYRCTYGKDKNCPQEYYRQEEIDKMFTEALGDLYIDDEIAQKIKEQLKESHLDQVAFEKKERTRLQSEYTQRKHHLDLMYEDRLAGIITPELYKEKQNGIQAELAQIQSDINRLGKANLKYKEEGSTLLELLKGFKATYVKQDYKGKAEILTCVLDKAILKGNETQFIWKPPFDCLFSINALMKKEAHAHPFIKLSERGE